MYAQGRTDKSKPIVTYLTSKKSKHCQNPSKAFDIAFTGLNPYNRPDAQWKQLADLGRELGLIPGYYFKRFQDKPHFEIN